MPRMAPFYRVCWWIARTLFRFYFRWKILGIENVPKSGPVVLACNHVSYVDPPLVGAALTRPVYFLARSTLFRNWFFGGLIRKLNALPVDRDGGGGKGLKAVVDVLENGDGIILFPEGTRSPDGSLMTARAGIGLTVIKAVTPVVPVRLVGVHEAWPRQRRFPKSMPVQIHFGKPMDFSALRQEAETCDRVRLKAIYQEVADDIMAAIGALGN